MSVTQRKTNAQPAEQDEQPPKKPLRTQREIPHRIFTPAMFCFLLTGTSLSIYSQYITDKGAAESKAQFISWIKYLSIFVVNVLFVPRSTGSTSMTKRARTCIYAIAAIDVAAYALFVAGFSLSGAALSTVLFAACGQVFTAMQSVWLLKRPLNALQVTSVAVVVVGLTLRNGAQLLASFSFGTNGAATLSLSSSAELMGLAALVGSSLLYATMGTVYDVMLQEPQTPSHTDVMGTVAVTGLVALSSYVALYTIPRWQELVAGPLQQRGVTWPAAVAMWAVFGLLYNAHALFQRFVLKGEGALGVSLVNALRGPAVSVACALLFCSPAAPKQCLTPWSAASACVVAVGVGMWGVAKLKRPASTSKPSAKTQ